MAITYMDLIKLEIEGIYGTEVLRHLDKTMMLYDIYDGKGQGWEVPSDLDYEPTQKN